MVLDPFAALGPGAAPVTVDDWRGRALIAERRVRVRELEATLSLVLEAVAE